MIVYIIDTSTWIDLSGKYPLTRNDLLWKNIGKLINKRRITCPNAVFKEIDEVHNPELHEWCKKNHNKLFIKDTKELVEQAAVIKSKNRKWQLIKERGPVADSYIIALAYIKKQEGLATPIIVTQEDKRRNNRIPSVAESYGIKPIDMAEFVKQESLTS